MRKKPPKIPIGTAENPVNINLFLVLKALRNFIRWWKKKHKPSKDVF